LGNIREKACWFLRTQQQNVMLKYSIMLLHLAVEYLRNGQNKIGRSTGIQ